MKEFNGRYELTNKLVARMRKACEMVRSMAENLQGFKLVFEDLEYEHKGRSISESKHNMCLDNNLRPRMGKEKKRK